MLDLIIDSVILNTLVFFVIYISGRKMRKETGESISKIKIILTYFLSLVIVFVSKYIMQYTSFSLYFKIVVSCLLIASFIYVFIASKNKNK